jgi:sulfate adenylyltransferase
MTELVLNKRQYLELEKLALGVFAPVRGFMNEDDFLSVAREMRLTSGEPYTLPIFLDVSKADADRLKGVPRVSLLFQGRQVGTLAPQSAFTCDKTAIAQAIFGTTEMAHPGVRQFMACGDWFLGGETTLTQRADLDISAWEITPDEAKAEFARRGWRTIAGFQTRNVPHRAHEYLQRAALEWVDGIFIQPLVGWKKKGDYTPEAVVAGYSSLIGNYLPPPRAMLGVLSTNMRYAGPREAVFHAIIRRNYGCTHFIVGRDHAGVGNYYGKYAGHELTDRFRGELGIEIMQFHGTFYCPRCDGIATEKTCAHWHADENSVEHISGTKARGLFSQGDEPDLRLMRAEVVQALGGLQMFIEEDEK